MPLAGVSQAFPGLPSISQFVLDFYSAISIFNDILVFVAKINALRAQLRVFLDHSLEVRGFDVWLRVLAEGSGGGHASVPSPLQPPRTSTPVLVSSGTVVAVGGSVERVGSLTSLLLHVHRDSTRSSGGSLQVCSL